MLMIHTFPLPILIHIRTNTTTNCKKSEVPAERELAARKRDDGRKAKYEVKFVT